MRSGADDWTVMLKHDSHESAFYTFSLPPSPFSSPSPPFSFFLLSLNPIAHWQYSHYCCQMSWIHKKTGIRGLIFRPCLWSAHQTLVSRLQPQSRAGPPSLPKTPSLKLHFPFISPLSHLPLLIHYFLCECACAWTHTCHRVPVKSRRQLVGVSCLLRWYGCWGLNSCS